MIAGGTRIAILINDGFDGDVITARKADDAAAFAEPVLRAIDQAARRAGNDRIA